MRCIVNGPFRDWPRGKIVDIPQDQADDLIAANLVNPWYPIDDDLPAEGFAADDAPTAEQVLAGVAALAGADEAVDEPVVVAPDNGPADEPPVETPPG
jgi:hypothetical protein